MSVVNSLANIVPTGSDLETPEAHDNNISAAARAAGIERMSIYKMIRRLGLEEEGTKKRAPTGDDDSEESTGHER